MVRYLSEQEEGGGERKRLERERGKIGADCIKTNLVTVSSASDRSWKAAENCQMSLSSVELLLPPFHQASFLTKHCFLLLRHLKRLAGQITSDPTSSPIEKMHRDNGTMPVCRQLQS